MNTATSLAASIKDYYRIEPVLIEGHDGIFEVSITGDTIYTNRSECSVLPETRDILKKLQQHGGRPVKPLPSVDIQELSLDGAACPLPVGTSAKQDSVSIQKTIVGVKDDQTAENTNGECGCTCDSC